VSTKKQIKTGKIGKEGFRRAERCQMEFSKMYISRLSANPYHCYSWFIAALHHYCGDQQWRSLT